MRTRVGAPDPFSAAFSIGELVPPMYERFLSITIVVDFWPASQITLASGWPFWSVWIRIFVFPTYTRVVFGPFAGVVTTSAENSWAPAELATSEVTARVRLMTTPSFRNPLLTVASMGLVRRTSESAREGDACAAVIEW